MGQRTDALPTDFESLKQLCLEQAKLLQEKTIPSRNINKPLHKNSNVLTP